MDIQKKKNQKGESKLQKKWFQSREIRPNE